MNFVHHLARNLAVPVHRVEQALIGAAEATVIEFLTDNPVTPPTLSNQQQAGIIAALRIHDPKVQISLRQQNHHVEQVLTPSGFVWGWIKNGKR